MDWKDISWAKELQASRCEQAWFEVIREVCRDRKLFSVEKRRLDSLGVLLFLDFCWKEGTIPISRSNEGRLFGYVCEAFGGQVEDAIAAARVANSTEWNLSDS